LAQPRKEWNVNVKGNVPSTGYESAFRACTCRMKIGKVISRNRRPITCPKGFEAFGSIDEVNAKVKKRRSISAWGSNSKGSEVD